MYKIIFKLNKFGDKAIDRDITIVSITLDLEFTSKNKIKSVPNVGTDFILENEEFSITRKVDSIQKLDNEICYVKIVFLDLKRLKPKPKIPYSTEEFEKNMGNLQKTRNLGFYQDPYKNFYEYHGTKI